LISFRAIGIGVLFLTASLAAAAQPAWIAGKVDCDGDLIAVHFTSSTRGWIAGDNGFLASTTDGGRNWTEHKLNIKEDINEIYFRNSDNGYLVAGRKMFVTSDAGRNWRETAIVNPGDVRIGTPEFLSIRFADKRRGIIVGSVLNQNDDVIDSLVMRTEDGGETWHRIIVPTKTELFHLDFVGSSKVWLVGDRGVILYSNDAGRTWLRQHSGTERALYNVDFRDSNDGWAVGGRGTILRTENGGRTWELVPTSFPATFMRVDFADDKNGWIVGHGGTILRSGDRGKTWVKQESGTASSLYGLFMDKRFGFAVGEAGVIIAHVR
jgi:photosystem II stability/assembly factor-like uncharacterized protein